MSNIKTVTLGEALEMVDEDTLLAMWAGGERVREVRPDEIEFSGAYLNGTWYPASAMVHIEVKVNRRYR